MLQVARWRIILVIAVAIIGMLFAAPNVLPANVLERMPGFVRGSTMNLGLDLRGGSQLLLEVDLATLRQQRLEQIADDMSRQLRESAPRIRAVRRGIQGDVARVRLNDASEMARALERLEEIVSPIQVNQFGNSEPDVEFRDAGDGVIEARVTDVALTQLARQSVRQSIEVIRRRVDPTGVAEVTIVPQGDDRIVVQAPGESDPEVLRDRIGQTALLTFHLPAENIDPLDAQEGRLPSDAVFFPYADQETRPGGIVVRRRPELTGEYLNNARAGFDAQTNESVVNFRFNGRGSRIFCNISSDNVGRQFAIVLDGQVLTDPVFNEPICGGAGQISGSFTPQSAQELALLLNAGALPVPLTVIEERTVGAELGQDAINSGALAGIIGAIATLVFMALAYGLFGLIACLALIINGVLIVAAMSLVGAALTLPGIAGLILTIAMAVDANVLIYERMREEQAAGRGPALAIDAGFSRAMVTILDANLTTILAALILFQFGVGPVRGFAWTLSIGVITSVFTAVLVTQILLALWYRATRPKKLPIY
jgi:protein-export membrane protein SecD